MPSSSSFHDAHSPHCLDSLEPPSTACLFRTSRTRKIKIDRNTFGVNNSPIPLLQVDAPVVQPPKNAAASSEPPHKAARTTFPNPGRHGDDLDPPGSNILFCPNFVSMTLGQKGACWWFILPKLLKYETYRIEVLKFVSSVRQNQRVGWSKLVFVAVEVLTVGSKPRVVVGECISKDERHDLGAAAPLSTRVFFLEHESAGVPVQSSPKLVEHIGSGSTRFEEQLSPCIA